MIEKIRNWQAKRWLRQNGIKLSQGILPIPKEAQLILEEGTSLNVGEMHFSRLEIGAMTYIRSGGELWNVSRIGRFCSISNNVILGQEKGGRGHPLHWISTHPFQMEANIPPPPRDAIASTQIGHDVWIGRDVMIMEGVCVGTGSVIASRSLVTHDVPAYAIVAGTPARVIRYRHPPELAARLLASCWWEIHVDELRGLPLGQPEHFLDVIGAFPKADYRKALLTRNSWESIKSDS